MSAEVLTLDPVTEYAVSVVDGNIVAGQIARLACERHLEDLETGPDRGFFFDPEEAQYLFDFFGTLHLWEGKWSGQKFKLELWQKFIIGSIFGWRRFEDGKRRYRTVYLEIARKNAKSTLLGGIGLYMLDADGEAGAQVYSAATKKDQAKIIFNCSKRLAEKTPGISKRVTAYLNNLSVLESYSKFEPLASDSKKADGFSVSCGLVDELHEHPNGGMMDVLETGTASREQPLIIYITTAGEDRMSVCYEQHEYSKAILKGKVQDDTYFPMIYNLDEGDDWRNEEVWPKANPNLNVSIFKDDLIRKRDKAKHILRQQTAFRRKHCNEWCGSESKWVDIEIWIKRGKQYNPALLKKEKCYGGLDLSSKLDLTAFVLVFPPKEEGGIYRILPFFWLPKEDLREKAKKDRCPYDQWAAQGYLELTEGNVVDYRAIRKKIIELGKVYNILEIGYDPWNATETGTKLDAIGFEMVEVRQGHKTLSEPMKHTEALIVNGQIAHNNNPVLEWMVENTIVRKDPNGNIAPDKAKSRQKIDGVVAIITAMSRVINQVTFESVYKTRGLTVLKGKKDKQ